MPDLDRALRDLLTDEHLSLPTRPDAVRIVREGVRRRRRRRTIVVSAAATATVAVAVVAATTLPAALDAGGHQPATPVQPSQHYDVAWIGAAAPTPWSPPLIQPPPPSLKAPRCLADQLAVGPAVPNGGGGAIFTTIRLRNISAEPCRLVGRPERVAAQAPGRADAVAAQGLHLGSSGVGGDLQPGHLGYLTVETNRDCPSRPYPSLSVTLPSGTSFSVPVKVDAGCGLRTGGLGVQVPQPTAPPDPRSRLTAHIDPVGQWRPGSAAYVVTLSNPTDAAISLKHCPGYEEDVTKGQLAVVRQSYALNCATVQAIAPHASVRYQMRVGVPVDTRPGSYTLRWTLLVNDAVTTSAAVTISS